MSRLGSTPLPCPSSYRARTSAWYLPRDPSGPKAVAFEAFQEAKAVFGQLLTNDARKQEIASQSYSMHSVLDAVRSLEQSYDASKRGKKAAKWLMRFSSRINHYSNIMDVLVQQQPEYVSLAWGAMKILFVALTNHENMVAVLAKSLCQVADILPRTEFASMLYPTDKMKSALVELYALILRLLIRAQDWYQESKALHVLHSITRPPEVRFKDLILEVERLSRNIDNLSQSGSQAEQRDMHLKMDELQRVVFEIRETMIMNQSLNMAAHVDTSHRLTDLQISSVLSFLSKTHLVDPIQSLKRCAYLRDRRKQKRRTIQVQPFWLSPRLKKWTIQEASALTLVKGSFRSRFAVKDFSIDVIELLRTEKIPTIWAVQSSIREFGKKPTTIDVLKYLTAQAIQVSETTNDQRSYAVNCARMQSATSEKDWCTLLTSILVSFPLIYVVLELEVVDLCFMPAEYEFAWRDLFNEILQQIRERSPRTIVKVMLLSSAPSNVILSETGGKGEIVLANKAAAPRSPFSPRQSKKAKSRAHKAAQVNNSFLSSMKGAASL